MDEVFGEGVVTAFEDGPLVNKGMGETDAKSNGFLKCWDKTVGGFWRLVRRKFARNWVSNSQSLLIIDL
eukprot:gene23468-28412_t